MNQHRRGPCIQMSSATDLPAPNSRRTFFAPGHLQPQENPMSDNPLTYYSGDSLVPWFTAGVFGAVERLGGKGRSYPKDYFSNFVDDVIGTYGPSMRDCLEM